MVKNLMNVSSIEFVSQPFSHLFSLNIIVLKCYENFSIKIIRILSIPISSWQCRNLKIKARNTVSQQRKTKSKRPFFKECIIIKSDTCTLVTFERPNMIGLANPFWWFGTDFIFFRINAEPLSPYLSFTQISSLVFIIFSY